MPARHINVAVMDLRALQYVVRVAELGSITRAAQHLNVAQPALTRHIQRLEEEVGAPLFTRASRGVTPTPAGQRLLECAARILRDLERTRDDIAAKEAHPIGKVVLGVTSTLCPVLAPELLERMRRLYPQTELKIVNAGYSVLPGWVEDGRVDLAIIAGMQRNRMIAATLVAREEMVLICAAGRQGDGDRGGDGIVSAAELAATPLILGDGTKAALELLLDGHGIALRLETEVNDPESIRLLVQRGFGATILPYGAVRRDCEAGLVRARRLTESGIFRSLFVATPAARSSSPAREAALAVVRAVLAEMDAAGGFTLGLLAAGE